jgi:hypothetical protein
MTMRQDEQDDLQFRAGFSRARNGILATELAAMTDDELASWQAGWRAETANHILAEKEWQRRKLTHEFGLNRQLAEYAAKWQRFSAYVGVVGTLVGAILGVVATSYSQS